MKVRNAHPGDQISIDDLILRTSRASPRLWEWEKYLFADSFIVAECKQTIIGAFLVWPDESPVAWVRLVALDDDRDVDEWLDLTLPLALDGLRHRGTRALAWMDYRSWAAPYLKVRGFKRLVEVITLRKLDRSLPDTDASKSDVDIHIASETDVPAIVTVERAAFTPYWQCSETTMRRRMTAAYRFIVAKAAGSVIGYAEGSLNLPVAHLNRIAVHPAHQGSSIGALLLEDMLRGFWRSEAERITLNTQANNHFARRLYRRFGFRPAGDSVTAWERPV